MERCKEVFFHPLLSGLCSTWQFSVGSTLWDPLFSPSNSWWARNLSFGKMAAKGTVWKRSDSCEIQILLSKIGGEKALSSCILFSALEFGWVPLFDLSKLGILKIKCCSWWDNCIKNYFPWWVKLFLFKWKRKWDSFNIFPTNYVLVEDQV